MSQVCPRVSRLTKLLARRGIRAGVLAVNPTHRELASMALLWPALAAESASEFASALAREFVGLAVEPDAAIKAGTRVEHAKPSGPGAGRGAAA